MIDGSRIDHYRASARKVADKHQATFVPFQEMFDQALGYTPALGG